MSLIQLANACWYFLCDDDTINSSDRFRNETSAMMFFAEKEIQIKEAFCLVGQDRYSFPINIMLNPGDKIEIPYDKLIQIAKLNSGKWEFKFQPIHRTIFTLVGSELTKNRCTKWIASLSRVDELKSVA